MSFTILNHQQILIINADDLGYDPHIDQGIMELIEKGLIRSTSFMVNLPNSSSSAHLLHLFQQQNPKVYLQCSFGLHLNLTEGQPLNSQIKGTQLAPQGKFIGKTAFYELAQSFDSPMATLIEGQIRFQIKEFMRLLGRRPSHLDGHNHVHLIPIVAKVAAQVMSQMGIYRMRGLNQDLSHLTIPINQVFLNNFKSCKSIFEEKLIISPSHFVGLQSFGNLKAQPIDQIFNEIKQFKKSVELMCHPGYPNKQGVAWIANPDRLSELQQLQSEQFNLLRQKRVLSSYLSLQATQQESCPRLLIYSKLQKGTGNRTTTLRYKEIFQALGFQVYLWNTQEIINLETQSSDLLQFLLSFGISLILGVNASRSANIIHKATRFIGVPYILVIAGTDANITFQTQEGRLKLKQPLQGSACLISLSKDMTEITQKVVQSMKLTQDVITICQSSCVSDIALKGGQRVKLPKKQFVFFPTSFRRVKCVHHILKQLNSLVESDNWQVIVAGPILDQEYYKDCLPLLGKVNYVGVLPREQYIQYLQTCFVMINTSQSEGMSCSILEAFQVGAPVIVRKNKGNQQLVKHMYNGLIYQHPDDFPILLQNMKQNSQLRKRLVQCSKQLFHKQYCKQKQMQSYQQVVERYFRNNLFGWERGNKKINIFSPSTVHPCSNPNLQLFKQIQHTFKTGDSVLDLGCGSGIFGIVVFSQNEASQLDIWLSQIKLSTTALALYNYRQSVWTKIRSITCIQSNLFDKIYPPNPFSLMLFNPPQSPFQNPLSRPDKNGGSQAIKFYQPALSYLAQGKAGCLYFLHSLMAWPQHFRNLQMKLGLRVVWESEREVHRIKKDDYDQMESGLSDYILKHLNLGRAQISFKDDIFYVPAAVYRIQSQ